MVFEAIKKFKINQQKTPMFILGFSLGGLIATHMMNSVMGRNMFSGLITIAPFYNDYEGITGRLYKVTLPMSYIRPKLRLYGKAKYGPSEEYMEKYKDYYRADNRIEFARILTGVIFHQLHRGVKKCLSEGSHIPACFIVAAGDTRVCNQTIYEASREATHPQSELNVIADALHCNVNFEEQYLRQNVTYILNFCDKILASKSESK